jgi:phosphatidylserine/phosphatidylglycerophosphate/cardiolipin synthase-like enzyme
VVRDEILCFHPKVYLFTDDTRYAAFIGSSNLTHGGFHANSEVNTLIEGTFEGDKGQDIRKLQQTLLRWLSSDYSLEPTGDWLEDYRERHRAIVANAIGADVPMPPIREDDATSARWLATADWSTFFLPRAGGAETNGADSAGVSQRT